MNDYTSYAESLANSLKNNIHFDDKLEFIHDEVLRACYKLAGRIGDNRPMSEIKDIVDSFSELIDNIPGAYIGVSFWKKEEYGLCERLEWENADCAMISSENISLKHKCNGRYETMAEDIGILIFGCIDKSEVKEDMEVDWDGNQSWQYIYKK